MTSDFPNWLNKIKSSTKKIPNLNDLIHGSSFETEDFSGYNLSLLAVKYLYDKLGIDRFKKIISSNNTIIELGNNIIEEAFHFYDKELGKTK